MEEVKNSPNLDDVFDDSKAVAGGDSSHSGSDMRRKNNRGGRRKKIILDLNCPLCESGVKFVDYKDVYQLKKFTSVRGKIIHSEKSGACRKHQRQLLRAIKRARYIALLPYVHIEG